MPFLKIESGPDADTIRPIRSKRIAIGRSPDSGVVVDDDTVSSLHASILYLNKAYFIEDHGSANVTYVNEIVLGEEVGDLVRVASAQVSTPELDPIVI